MSDGTRIRWGLPRNASLAPADLPRPGTHVNLSLFNHDNHPSALGVLDDDGVTLTLDVPPAGMSELHLAEGDALGVAWALRGMMCRMRVVRIADRPGTSPTEFTVRLDEGPYLIERREFFRVEVERGVIIRRPDGDWAARTGNICRSGALLFATADLPIGAVIDITIDLGERHGGPFSCHATVVRDAVECDQRAYGIEFSALPHDDDHRLARFVAWQQQQQP